MVTLRLEVIRQPDVDDTRFNDGVTITVVDFEDLLHPRQTDHDAAADRQTTAGQTRTGSKGGGKGTFSSLQACTTRTTCSVEVGNTTISGLFFSMVKPSHS